MNKKKLIRRIVAFALVMCMAFPAAGGAAYGTTTYTKYAAAGDSVALASGYVELLGTKLGCTAVNKSYEHAYPADYRYATDSAFEDADLITFNMGSDCVYDEAIEAVSQKLYTTIGATSVTDQKILYDFIMDYLLTGQVSDFSAAITILESKGLSTAVLNKIKSCEEPVNDTVDYYTNNLLEAMALLKGNVYSKVKPKLLANGFPQDILTGVEEALGTTLNTAFATGYSNYTDSAATCLDTIKTTSGKKANVAVLGFYNPLDKLSLEVSVIGEKTLTGWLTFLGSPFTNVSTNVSAYTGKMNTFASKLCGASDVFVDISGTSCDKDSFPGPSSAGHTYICNQVYNAVKDLEPADPAGVALTSSMIKTIEDQEYTGEAIKPSVTVVNGTKTLTKGTHYTVEYDSNNVNLGTSTVTVTAIEGSGYTGSATKTFKIVAKNVSGCQVSGLEEEYTYTGSQIKPEITMTGAGGAAMVEGTDYTVSYGANTEVGTGTVTVTGKGNYTGTEVLTFRIVQEEVAKKIASAELTKEQDTYTYTGKAISPAVTVKGSSGEILNAGTDYKVTYSSNKNPGTATIKVTGINDYEGDKTLTFTIIPKGTSLTGVAKGSKSFTAKWKKQAVQTTGYLVQYGMKSDFSDGKIKTVKSSKTVKLTVKGLKAKKKYYVRIATYKTVGGVKYQSAWSKAKTVKTK